MSLLDRFVSELSYYDRISCNQMIRRLHWECSVSRCELDGPDADAADTVIRAFRWQQWFRKRKRLEE